MGIFSRKKKKETAPAKVEDIIVDPCKMFGHIYKDFPPYIRYSWGGNDGNGVIKIEEYYVCHRCHNRKKVTLEEWSYSNSNREHFFSELEQMKKEYANLLKPQAVVEDMINDMIYVDEQKLKYWEQLHAPEPPKTDEFEFKINLPERDKK